MLESKPTSLKTNDGDTTTRPTSRAVSAGDDTLVCAAIPDVPISIRTIACCATPFTSYTLACWTKCIRFIQLLASPWTSTACRGEGSSLGDPAGLGRRQTAGQAPETARDVHTRITAEIDRK